MGEKKVLCAEARYLHHRLFGRDPSDNLVDAYVRAHTEIPELYAADARQLSSVNFIVSRGLDAVGIEPWFRGKARRHALSAKLLLLCFLAECGASHPEFTRRAASDRMALARISNTTLTAILRLLRGRVQKGWHGLV